MTLKLESRLPLLSFLHNLMARDGAVRIELACILYVFSTGYGRLYCTATLYVFIVLYFIPYMQLSMSNLYATL